MASSPPERRYLALPGPPANSLFRLEEIQKAIVSTVSNTNKAVSVRSIFIHYVCPQDGVDVSILEDVNSKERECLDQLLHYGDMSSKLNDDEETGKLIAYAKGQKEVGFMSNTLVLSVFPRKGTISPWSSKATSIAHVCGLKGYVKRIERGVLFSVAFEKELGLGGGFGGVDNVLFDRMTQTCQEGPPTYEVLFGTHEPLPVGQVDLRSSASSPLEAIESANRTLGLALDSFEMQYLLEAFSDTGPCPRNPYDVELFMFAQVNSEHCRHKQFNASWEIDGQTKPYSLFEMIRNTHTISPGHTISAYSDNAAVLEGNNGVHWAPDPELKEWKSTQEMVHFVAKVETHNHPTAVSPYPGAATGSGGEIRDEGAVGRGSKPKAGLAGFSVSDLLIPGHQRPWELNVGRPNHIASPLDIMLEAPIGSAAFNNEFGRPCIMGYFRTLTTIVEHKKVKEIRGYHKPIMLAGGLGTVRPVHAIKEAGMIEPGAYLIVLGGPAMLIGLGGGAASSITSGEGSVDLDFASVQRGNPEQQRRAQMVIDACVAMGKDSPIRSIHDVGAGGLSNALPELVHDAGLGATFELREVENADKGMSPLQIWCCEAQERYVMAVAESGLKTFVTIAKRERCGFSVVGRADGGSEAERRLVLKDRDSRDHPKVIDLPMSTLFGKPPKMHRNVATRELDHVQFDSSLETYLPNLPLEDRLAEAVDRVLKLPSVGSKNFLITIGDRTVTGLVTRDQMVGPWQVPVADVAVTATSLSEESVTGEAMAMGEKPTLALISPAASARMAVAESILNLAAADIQGGLKRVRLSANWMAAGSHPGEGAALYEAVEAVGMDLCPNLGISIPVGKDSVSMKMKWKSNGEDKEVTAPVSLVVTAFAAVEHVGKTWTPALKREKGSELVFVDLALGKKEMGGSALCQVFQQVGTNAPDVRDAGVIRAYFDACKKLRELGIVHAYHDRSDGGIFTAIVEMAFAGRVGVDIKLKDYADNRNPKDIIAALFNEELGAVFQVSESNLGDFKDAFGNSGFPKQYLYTIGVVKTSNDQTISIDHDGEVVYGRTPRGELQQKWSETSYAMQRLRDNPLCADQEYENILDDDDPGLTYTLTFTPSNLLFTTLPTSKPRVAILREQGVNGHAEMAFAFKLAGFTPVDVHMTDIIDGNTSLLDFVGIAACGGFSYGDVLGAGAGWAKSVLLHEKTRQEFENFFKTRNDTFALGVCNGCQFFSRLTSLIPGTEYWPTFERNVSEQYEARLCMVEISNPPGLEVSSVFLNGMHGARFPVATAHGEGKATFASARQQSNLEASGLASIRYVDNRGNHTDRYPYNPNGSPGGLTGVRNENGRVLAMMPHPERSVLQEAVSYKPTGWGGEWGGVGPWVRIFRSARRWVG
ncbi:putative phosphoribosylformylglycinamidine synthase [Tuber brumale]|nr:putative phosphoribosylformylglycinamidine synthase [Tuber brumale]